MFDPRITALIRVFDAVSAIRLENQQDEEPMPLQTARILMLIAGEPGITMATLVKRTGLAQSSISRSVAALGEYHRLGKPGYNLVEAVEDPHERRRKAMFLSARGRKVMGDIVKAFDPTATHVEFVSAKEWQARAYGSIRGARRGT